MLALALVLAFAAALACDPLRAKGGGSVDLGDDTGDYPYHLVVGGGLSETLDVVTVRGPGDLAVAADVAPTGSAIDQTAIHGGELYAVCSLSNSVVVYRLASLAIDREIGVGAGANPMELAFVSDALAYVANYASDSVTLYDLSPGTADADRLVATIPMPAGDALPRDAGVQTWARPGGIVATSGRVFVALSNLSGVHVAGGPGLVAVIDPDARALARTFALSGRDTIELALDEATGFLWALSAGTYAEGSGFAGDGMAERIDPAAEAVVASVPVAGAPTEMAFCPGRKAFLGNAKEAVVLSLDPDTGEALPAIDIRDPNDPLGLSFVSGLACDSHGLLYATDFNHDALYVIDTGDGNRVLARVTVNDGPDTLTLAP